MRRVLFLFCFLWGFMPMEAQVQSLTVDDVIEWLNTNEDGTILEDDLRQLAESPLWLNRATRTELTQIPFLSDLQIDNFLTYRDEHHGLLSIYDLKLIDGWDLKTIQYLLPFVQLGNYDTTYPNLRQLMESADQELFVRAGRCLNTKQGYKSVEDSVLAQSPNKRYLGGEWQHSFRYKLSASNNLQLGVVGEQDAGEPFMKKQYNRGGYDYYSIHLWTGNWKYLKAAVVGDYKLSIGQGVIMNQSFSIGKSFPASHTGTLSRMIRPHYSSSETKFLRGVATTFSLWGGEYSLFYSFRKLDATGDKEVVTAFKEDGYHRTVSDWEKKNNITMQMAGGRIYYERPYGELGLTGLVYYFDKSVNPSERAYNRYYFRGKDNYNIGVDFRGHWRMFHCFGEWAMSKNRALSGIVSLQIPFSGRFYLLTSFRNYSKRYQAYFASPFSESSSAFNEQGAYVAMEYKPLYQLSLQVAADFYRYPFLRYGVDASSDGAEFRLRGDYTQTNWTLLIDYRFRRKEINAFSNTTILQTQDTHSLKTQWKYTSSWRFKTTAAIRYRENEQEKDNGVLLSQEFQYQPVALQCRLVSSVALFSASDYDVRVWLYENNGLYASSSNSFYGKGVRFSLGLSHTFCSRLTLWGRYAVTYYADRDHIGSGLEQVEGNTKSDLAFYVLFRF